MAPVLMSSQGMALATAMALSGTVIVLALRRQKSTDDHHHPQTTSLKSCIYSSNEKRRERNKKKRVHFAEDVVEPVGNSEDFRRAHNNRRLNNINSQSAGHCSSPISRRQVREMPANRMALYNGILRNRVQRVACSY